jgi:hypothetical protein
MRYMICFLILLIGNAAYLSAQMLPVTAPATPPKPNPDNSAAVETSSSSGQIDGFQTNNRWREGTRLTQVTGQFQVGDRLQFTSSDSKLQFVVLENLMAERVARMSQESSDQHLHWIIQGTITEFNGKNYLHLQTATTVRKQQEQPKTVGQRTLPATTPATTVSKP